MQLFFDAQQLLGFFFFDGGDRHAGPARDYVFNVFAVDHAGGGIIQVIFFAKDAQVLAFLAFFVGIEARLLELVVRDRVFHSVDDELQPFLHFGDLFRQRSLAQLYARSGFVNQIDGLVRQKAVGNVAVGMRHRKVDGVVGIRDRVKFFVAVFDSEKNFGRISFVRRRNFYRLEAALQRAVFLDGLAILPRSGRADALNFAARKRRLEDVGGVKRTFRRARAHQRVQFVNKDDAVLRLHQFLHDGLQPFFELSAIFGAGDDQRKIKRQNAFVGEE